MTSKQASGSFQPSSRPFILGLIIGATVSTIISVVIFTQGHQVYLSSAQYNSNVASLSTSSSASSSPSSIVSVEKFFEGASLSQTNRPKSTVAGERAERAERALSLLLKSEPDVATSSSLRKEAATSAKPSEALKSLVAKEEPAKAAVVTASSDGSNGK
ncbi:hypothetical protein EON65_12150 [archaeon]|nr:MAG: hypothetical protein EON65_12150 [archaeon]